MLACDTESYCVKKPYLASVEARAASRYRSTKCTHCCLYCCSRNFCNTREIVKAIMNLLHGLSMVANSLKHRRFSAPTHTLYGAGWRGLLYDRLDHRVRLKTV
eukprot:1259580-Rhodomonas_salina.2